VIILSKEFEIQGCIEVPISLSEDEFFKEFIGFIESKNWTFGGGINEIIDGFYINADGTKGKYVLEDMFDNIHDNLTNELFELHSLASLIYLINAGRELEFSYNDVKCFISKSGSTKTVSLWISEDEQAYDNIEDLIENAMICNQPLIHIFHATTLETLF
jgi:hypothetical protein